MLKLLTYEFLESSMSAYDFCEIGIEVFKNEAQALLDLIPNVNQNFEKACHLLLSTQGRVIITGMGKSGHIARKIASTFSSTGTPSHFVHPAEAIHGDLGMITHQDVLIMISYSGNTPEMLSLLPSLKRLNVPVIAVTGSSQSPLALSSEVHLDIAIKKEACPLGLAPTTSTTATLVMGDALAVALLKSKGFTKEDFAHSHPGGSLGKKLLLKIDQLWQSGHALPCVHQSLSISDALIEVTAKKLGMTCVVNDDGKLVGVYTDGDIRRTLHQQINIHHTPIEQVMTKNCITLNGNILAVEALNLMQEHTITSLVVINQDHCPQAVVHLHDVLRAGVV